MAKVTSKRAYWGIMGVSALSMLLTLGGGMSYSEPHAAAQRLHVEAPAAPPPPAPQCSQGKAMIAFAHVVGNKGDTAEYQCFCGAQEVAKATATADTPGPDKFFYGVSAGHGTMTTGEESEVVTPSTPNVFADGECVWEK